MNKQYTNLWQNWIAEIEKTVPKTNNAFNLKQGINDGDIKMYQSQIAVNLPEVLIEFYRANNVTDNADISVFQFDIKGCWYHLLPFSQIPVEWNDFESFDEEEVQSNYESVGISDKIIVTDYANENWIPFAVTDQGDMLLFDTQPSEKGVYGQIVELQNESWERNVVAKSLTELIENQIKKLQNGEREIIEIHLQKEEKMETNNKKYFEFKDEKSSKFWEITLENNALKTRYGKIGTAGQISEKQFENELSAEKEYHKLIAEKTKKGYIEIKENTEISENKEPKSAIGKLIKFKDIKNQLPPKSLPFCRKIDYDDELVYYISGNLEIENLDLDNIAKTFTDIEPNTSVFTVFVDGNLTAKNIYNDETDGSTNLIVTGDLYCDNVVVGGQEIYISKNINITGVFWGDYNHGDLVVNGNININVFIDTDYSVPRQLYENSLGGENDTVNFRFSDDSEIYNLDISDYQRVKFLFLDEVLQVEDEIDTDEIYGWGSLLSRGAFLENLQNNKPILNPDFNLVKFRLNGYKELLEICTDNQQDKLEINQIIDAFEVEKNQNTETIFNHLSEKINDAGFEFIINFDCKAETKDVSFVLKKLLERNFNESITFPTEQDFLKNYPAKEHDIANLFIDFDIPLRKKGFQLTFIEIDADSYFLIMHRTANEKNVNNCIKKIGLKSYPPNGLENFELDYLNVPTLFEHKSILEPKDLEIQVLNYKKVLTFFDDINNNESRIFLPKSTTEVFVNKEHKRESDGKKVDKSIYFLLDNGAEIIVWIAPKNILQKLSNKPDNFQILYKNINENVFQYKPILEIENGAKIIEPVWKEFLETIEKGVYFKNQFEEMVTANKIQTILNYQMVKEKYPNSWKDSDQMPWFANSCYAFDPLDDAGLETIKIIRKISNSNNDFDAKSFYYVNYAKNNAVHLSYLANYHHLNDALYGMFYSKGNVYVPFYDYKLYKEALIYWNEAQITLPKKNEEYLKALVDEKYFIDLKKSLILKQKEDRRQNYTVTKPFETIDIDGITFALKDRNEAQEILKACVDFDGNQVYDAFEMLSYEDPDDDYKSFFLVAENEVTAEKLYLETLPTDNDNLYVLGYIFLKELTLQKYVEAYEDDFSPPIICLENATINSLILSGTEHYFHKNLNCINLYGFYNHGSLIVKGKVNAKFIAADDFNMKIEDIETDALWSDDRDIEMMCNYYNEDKELQSELNYLFGTHSLEYCLQDRFIYKNKYGYNIKDDGNRGESRFAAGEETFFDCLRKGENVLDLVKIENARVYFLENAFEYTKNLFSTNTILQNLAIEKSHFHYNNQDDNISYYFTNDENSYNIGYWNTPLNISAVVMLDKTGNKENHSLNVYYWNKDNTKVRFQYTNNFEDHYLFTLICQKIFAEAVQQLENPIQNIEDDQTTENEDNQTLKILFPNSFTTGKNKPKNAENLQNQFNFSNEYANFLNIQNGFNGYDFDDADDKKRQKYLQKTTIELPDYYLNDIKNLYNPEELIEENEENIFKDYLLMIGVDKGGNNFVEVLHGQFKGYIGFIDHEMYAGSENIEEFIETFSLENFEKSTIEERTDMLCDEDIMMQFYAKNMHDFIQNCIIFVDGEVKVIELEKIR